MRFLIAIALCACTLATTGGCGIGASMVWSALYRKDVRLDASEQEVAPWIGPDTRAEPWVVERFDLVRANTRNTDDQYWKFPGDLSRMSYESLVNRIERFDPHVDPDDPRDQNELLETVVCLRPVVVLITPNPGRYPNWRFPIAVRTWTADDPEIRWFSPDMGVHPTRPVFDSPDRAHIDVPWGRLVLTRERIMQSDTWQGYRLRWSWVVTTEPPPETRS